MKTAVLQFSGGRDSLALLLYMRPDWPLMTVVYTASGDEYPETRALVEKVKRLVPDFVEVQGQVQEVYASYGPPSDLVQTSGAWAGHYSQAPLLDRHFCCFQSIMLPMHVEMVKAGVKTIFRGQRLTDNPKSPVHSGQTLAGVTVVYPIQDWTEKQVEDFILTEGFELPPYYTYGATSAPDCMHCTAWLEHNSFPYLQEKHPVEALEVQRRLRRIKFVVEKVTSKMDHVLGV